MYVPAHFAVFDVEALYRLIRENPLGVLVTHGPNGLDANHVPFDLDTEAPGSGVLRAHVARANPVWKALRDGDEVLVVFRAEDAYMSPNWYPSTHETHKQVPTWNYRVAHATGRVAIREDETFLRPLVERLTRTHEGAEPAPWRMSDAPPDYLRAMMQAIVGLEIVVTSLVGKFKLSQNRALNDRLSLAETLKKKGALSLGQATLDAAIGPADRT